MVFVNDVYDMVVDTQFHKFYGKPFARILYLFLMKDKIGRYYIYRKKRSHQALQVI